MVSTILPYRLVNQNLYNAKKALQHNAQLCINPERYYTALVTLPERIHLVQISTVLCVPLSLTLIFLTFGFQVRFARRETWLRVMLILRPVRTLLSHSEHFAICCTSFACSTINIFYQIVQRIAISILKFYI